MLSSHLGVRVGRTLLPTECLIAHPFVAFYNGRKRVWCMIYKVRVFVQSFSKRESDCIGFSRVFLSPCRFLLESYHRTCRIMNTVEVPPPMPTESCLTCILRVVASMCKTVGTMLVWVLWKSVFSSSPLWILLAWRGDHLEDTFLAHKGCGRVCQWLFLYLRCDI